MQHIGFHPEQALLSDCDLREDKSVCVTNNSNTDPHHSTDHKAHIFYIVEFFTAFDNRKFRSRSWWDSHSLWDTKTWRVLFRETPYSYN